MAEFIEREAFKAEVRRLSTHYLNEWDTLGVLAAVDRIPAADVRHVVKAYWIGEGDGYADGEMVYDVWHCSNCDYTVDEGDNEPPQYNFCPNCGAMMEES